MSDRPRTQYVAVADADVAYQVVGDGPVDLLFCYGLGSHIEFNWQVPTVAAFLNRLASFSRLVLFDRRGSGASDGVARNSVPTVEDWTDDIAAVLDATGCDRAAILATVDMGPIAMVYAAMHPERVTALALVNTSARFLAGEGYPAELSPERLDELVAFISASWGTPEFVSLANPSGDAEFCDLTAQVLRASATPRSAAAQYNSVMRNDVRHALPLIQVPTLVMNVREQPLTPIEHGRYLAEHIDGATFVELPSSDLSFTVANLVLADEIAEFLTGARPLIEVDRVLATVLFVDIVESTQRVSELGDRKWRELLDAFRAALRRELERFRGREVNTRGDDILATFDGPARAISCAHAIAAAARPLGVEVRAGLHTGEVELQGDDIAGIAVHIGARVASLAGPGEVLVSSTVKDLVVGSGIEFDDRGEHDLKGVPGPWKLFSAVGIS